ncbi:MAG: beta-propeller domain-containing protein [Burkholderiales bacterium]|nr:beta-propeller domain-containing protein [Burkholderiales bacterium]
MNTTTRRTLAALFAAACAATLVSCGGGGGGSAAPAPAPVAQGLLRQAQPGDLAAYFRERIARRSENGMNGTMYPTLIGDTAMLVTAQAFSGTQLQEAGVDEDDLIKSDGETVYTIHPASWGTSGATHRLRTSRIQPDGSLSQVALQPLDNAYWPKGMYLASGAARLAVVGEKSWYGDLLATTAALTIFPVYSEKLAIDVFDTAGPQPAASGRIEIDGRVLATRMIGSTLYVASTWTPDLSIYAVPAGTPKAQVDATLKDLSASQLLPTVRVNGGAAQPLAAESQCLLQPDNASLDLQLTTITAIDLASPTLERKTRCIVGDGTTLYMSPTSVYLATSRTVWFASVMADSILPQEVTTDIHKFALQGLDVDYRGSGEIAGHLGWDTEKMPYRMSEHDGDLRVVGFTGSTGWGFATQVAGTTAQPQQQPSPATLTILREDAAQQKLVKVASLPNAQRPAPLGREGEQVYAVHFAGPRAYVVTFRRTDPLYVLDLSNPSDPRVRGELTVPGFSDYLYPVAGGRLLGIGRAANASGVVQGLQVSLFDVADPDEPRLLASRELGGQGSSSALDYTRHGVNLFMQGSTVRVALPVMLYTWSQSSASLERGLARFHVDTAAGTITPRPLVAAPSQDWSNIGAERALQTTNATYYLTGDQVLYTPEP